MIEFKIPVFDPFPALPVTSYDKHLSLSIHVNGMSEFPNLQYTQVYRVSHFNPSGIARHSFCNNKKDRRLYRLQRCLFDFNVAYY
jgi:hypothetical protein